MAESAWKVLYFLAHIFGVSIIGAIIFGIKLLIMPLFVLFIVSVTPFIVALFMEN